ncbi:DUF6882 domain-containing protein [Elusimicrobiota bacterium]
MSPKFQEILDKLAAAALDRQENLKVLLEGDPQWSFDKKTGKLVIGEGAEDPKRTCTFITQILGMESGDGKSWRWSWADQGTRFPEGLVKVASKLREYGKKEAMTELLASEVPLDDFTGHCLGLVASGLTKATFYYRAAYEAGAVYLLVKASDFEAEVDDPLARVSMLFPAFVENKDVPIKDHRRAFIEYLTYYGMKITQKDPDEKGWAVTGELGDSGRVLATFDLEDRLYGDILVSTEGAG